MLAKAPGKPRMDPSIFLILFYIQAVQFCVKRNFIIPLTKIDEFTKNCFCFNVFCLEAFLSKFAFCDFALL